MTVRRTTYTSPADWCKYHLVSSGVLYFRMLIPADILAILQEPYPCVTLCLARDTRSACRTIVAPVPPRPRPKTEAKMSLGEF